MPSLLDDTAETRDTIAAVYNAAPGTEILMDTTEHGATAQHLHSLQHVRTGDGYVLLVPQPSLADPNDPLRWSKLKKWIVLMNGVFYSFIGGCTGPIMAAGMVGLSESFQVPFQTITYANGATLICQGVFTTIWMPIAVKYGRRPVYLLSNLLMSVACIWLGLASTASYTPLIVGRAFLGIFEAPIESIVPSTVTDIFFLHERGEKVSIYGLAVLGGNELGPMLSAFIIQSLGLKWAFYIMGIFAAANEITMFFFMPETKFSGAGRPSVLPASRVEEKSGVTRIEDKKDSPDPDMLTAEHVAQLAKRPYRQTLAVCNPGDPNVNLISAFVRPFVLVAYPTVLWACITYGLSLSWNVILGASVAQLFAPPPYKFDSSQQGLVFLSPLVGSLIGTYLCGPLADRVANYYTKHNHGIREPEMRLPTCIIAAILTFVGALVSGLCYVHKTHWVGPIVGFGILSTGAQMGATLSMSYALDCHQELSVELMVTVASLKSAIAWIWTWVINDWIISDGLLVVLMVVATINVVVYGSSAILYFWGKRIRIWLRKTDMLHRLGLKDLQ